MSIKLGFHFPCFDGTYSASMGFLFFRYLQAKGISVATFIEYIQHINTIDDLKETIFEYADANKIAPEEYKVDTELSDYSPQLLANVGFVPLRVNSPEATPLLSLEHMH